MKLGLGVFGLFLSSSLFAGQYFQDFTSYAEGTTSFSDGSQLFSSHLGTVAAVVDTSIRELQLTAVGTTGTRSAYLLPDLDGGAPVYAFSAKWSAPVYASFPNSGADGFSFTFGQVASLNLTNAAISQESGYGTGLCFAVHTFRNNRPGFYIYVGTNEVAYLTNYPASWGTNTDQRHFFEVDWNYYRGLTVRMDSQTLFANVAVTNFTPRGGERFVWAARCGGETEYIRLDNIAIGTGGNYVRLPSSAPHYANNDSIASRADAFDGNEATFWGAPDPLPAYVGATFTPNNAVAIFAVTSPSVVSRSGDPQTFSLDGSTNTGGNWTTCGSGSGYFAGPKETRCWPVTNSAAFGAYRLNVTATRVANSGAYAGEVRAYAFSVVGSPFTWSRVNLAGNNWISIASSADGSRLILGGATQTYLSSNSGATWNLVQNNQQIVACSGNGSNLLTMNFKDGSSNLGYYSVNGGQSWAPNNLSGDCSAMAVSYNGSRGVAVAGTARDISSIKFSLDQGANWNQAPVGIATNQTINWSATCISSNGQLAAVAAIDDSIYYSTNGALVWRQSDAPFNHWTSLAGSVDGKILFAAAVNGIWISTNNGIHWTQTAAANGYWKAVASSADGSTLAAALHDNDVYISKDLGQTWSPTGAPGGSWTGLAISSDGTKLAGIQGFPDNAVYLKNLANGNFPPPPSPQLSGYLSGNNARLTWATASGGNFFVQQNTNLASTNWQDITWPVVINGSQYQVTVPNSGSAHTFFRLKSQ